MRRAAKVDANQPEMVEGLRRLGWSVHPTHQLGKGFPDLIVGRPGFNCLVEIKDGRKSPSCRELTPDEQTFHEAWKGPCIVALSVEDAAEKLLSAWRKWR
jgi:hypothetical protein